MSTKTRDFYKILRISRTATTAEIKIAYRKLALSLHPDRHKGDRAKTKAFQEASEAYNILIDNERRRQYDMANVWGDRVPHGWHNKNRRHAPPPNYRKVYTPHAPPDGKWNDAQKHYDMHYGDGMYRDSVKRAYARAKKRGDFDYHSPLGKGFTFDHDTSDKSSHNTYSSNSYEKNPYSKAEQGPPTVQFNYEEGYLSDAKNVLNRKKKVVVDLHSRRTDRQTLERQQEEDELMGMSKGSNGRVYKPFNGMSADVGCSVM